MSHVPAAVAGQPATAPPPASRPISKSPTHIDATGTIPHVLSYALHVPGYKVNQQPDTLPPPARPLFGGHSIAEAGGSSYAPKSLVLVWRVLVLLFAVAALVRSALDHQLRFSSFQTYGICAFTSAFILALACSLRYALTRSVDASAPSHFQGSTYAWLANIAVPVYQFAITAALFVPPIFWPFLRIPGDPLTFSILALNALPLAIISFDYALTARMRFKLFYALFFVLFVVGYLVLVWFLCSNGIKVYHVLDHINASSKGNAILYYIGFGLWGLVAALIMYVTSLILACTRRDYEADEQRYLRDKRVFGPDMNAAAVIALAEKDSKRYHQNNDFSISPSPSGREDNFDPGYGGEHELSGTTSHFPIRRPTNGTQAVISRVTSVDNNIFPPVEPASVVNRENAGRPSFPHSGPSSTTGHDPEHYQYQPRTVRPEVLHARPVNQYTYRSSDDVESYVPPTTLPPQVPPSHPEPPPEYLYTSYAFSNEHAPPAPSPPLSRRY